MTRIIQKFFWTAGWLSLLTSTAWPQNSLIDAALKSRESIVTIKAIQSGLIEPAKVSAARDPRTGRILFARNTKAGRFEKNGAGVILNASGMIVTNFHIIHGAEKIAVILHDGAMTGAQILSLNPEHDLSLLKIEVPFPLSPIPLADSNNIKLGDQVINIGSSQLLKETISGGVVTGLGTNRLHLNEKEESIELIEININLYKGDSGGPILNAEGELMGMIVAKLRHKDRSTFAIPSNKIRNLYLEFIK